MAMMKSQEKPELLGRKTRVERASKRARRARSTGKTKKG
jgi:hypothetical protein